jgi:hypothetical protein
MKYPKPEVKSQIFSDYRNHASSVRRRAHLFAFATTAQMPLVDE